MKNFIQGLIYGISYFSIIPISVHKFEANKSFYKGVLFSLPLVGFILAILVSGLYIMFSYIMPSWYSAFLLSILYLFLYGFIHLEGVSDTFDAYYASLSKKDVYKIIKEPHIGAIGAIGTFSFILLKVLALGYLLLHEEFLFIILALSLSRFSVFFALDLEFHEKSTFILSLQDSFKTNIFLKLLFLPISLLNKLILNILKKRIGFLNGDTLGFSIELMEIILLNIAIILI